MSDTPDSGAPGVLRQEGPHRVKVAPGSQSALAPSVGVGTKRLRPAIGAAPVPMPMGEADALPPSSNLRQRQGVGSSTTEIRRLPGRAAVNGRFAPGAEQTQRVDRPAEPSALEQRLAALSELNAKTSRSVTTFEAQVTAVTGPVVAGSAAADGPALSAPTRSLRTLFKRRSS